MTGIATANIKFNLSHKQTREDLLRILARNPGVLGLQEVSKDKAAGLKKFLAEHGYDIAIVNDVPIAYNKARFKLLDSNKKDLASGGLRNVKASWVALQDRNTGKTNVITNTHLIKESRDAGLHRREVQQLADLQRHLKQKFGNDVEYFLTGDLNTTNRQALRPLEATGLNLYRAPADTGPKGGRPDWIASSATMQNSRVVGGLLSDHNAYVGRFASGGDGGHSSPQQGGGGKGHHGGNNGGGNGNGHKGKGMTDAQQSAFDLMKQTLKDYGLPTLAKVLKHLILDGTTDPAQLTLALQNTDEWKARFAGNEMLRQKGLAVLSAGEYLDMERQYAQIMKNYGLPKGFYDDPADFAKFIGNSVSVNEVQQRVSAYADLAQREDPAILAQLQSMGLSQGDLLAYMIDPHRATPLIQQQYKTALLGGAARRAGVTADNGYLQQLADQGVSEQEAQQGYSLIAGSLADANTLSSVYGENYGLGDMQAEVFQGDAAAKKKRTRLASQERAAFSGSAGVGSLTQNTAGSY